MTKKEAKEWLEAFKKARFKCIVPNQVVEAMEVLGMTMKDIKKRRVDAKGKIV
jgi:hypothetical protein